MNRFSPRATPSDAWQLAIPLRARRRKGVAAG
jgi:hypothetical protein